MEFLNQFVPNAVIVVICVLFGMLLKWIFNGNARLEAGIPVFLMILGAILGIVATFVMEDFVGLDLLTAIAMGAVSGLGSVGVYQMVHQQKKVKAEEDEAYDELSSGLGVGMQAMSNALQKLVTTMVDSMDKMDDEE